MKPILALCSVLLALVLPTSAWATCNFYFEGTSGPTTTGPFLLEFDGDVKQVSANAPKGTVLYTQTYDSQNFVGAVAGHNPEIACTQYIDYWEWVVTTGPATGYQYTYETNIPGVGLRLWVDPATNWANVKTSVYSKGTQFSRVAKYRIELVKTTSAPLTAVGSIVGPIAEWHVQQDGGPLTVVIFRMRKPIVIEPTVPTCAISTPDVIVPLDEQSPADFTGVGTTLGEKDFNVSLACSGGDPSTSTNMRMFLTDQTTPANASNVLSLTAASTASGVGVQLLSSGTPVVFGQTADAPTTNITRNIAVGVPTVDVPMTARYIRTGSIGSGTVTAIATFTVDYL